jgi:hypothetical protein
LASYACSCLSRSGVQKLPRTLFMHDVQSELQWGVNLCEPDVKARSLGEAGHRCR